MTALAFPRLLGANGKPLRLDPDLDAPLVGPSTFAVVSSESNTEGCNAWRVWQPFAMLQLHGYLADWDFRSRIDKTHVAGLYKAHLICRAAAVPQERGQMTRWFKQMRDAGKVCIYECDDDLFSVFMTDQQMRRVADDSRSRKRLELERESSIWVLQRCDGVTVTTQHLASTVRQYTSKPVEVVPNAIDIGFFQRVQAVGTRTVPGLTIGWAGGNRPDTDLTEMAIAWGSIARRYPQVRFVVQGAQPWAIYAHVPIDQIVAVPWMPIEEYPKGLLDIDIGCCPLENRPFNRCKTPIKAYEYGVSGSAVVASPTVYRHAITHGENGYLATTAEEWEEALSLLVEREALRYRLAAQLRRDVVERWSLKKNYWRWPMAWNRLAGGA